jgi:hypothetical protein
MIRDPSLRTAGAVLALLVSTFALLLPFHAVAADSMPPAKAVTVPTAESRTTELARRSEAARRFDRALQLFESGDTAGALAEFKRAYEVFPDPLVLYNMGLVYAAMSRPVDAVDALERVLTDSGRLSAAQVKRARQILDDQQARVARLMVATKPVEARIEIDGIEVAKTPLEAPIRVAEGKHVIGAVAEGYAAANKEVFVAGNSDVQLAFELLSTQSQAPAHIFVRGHLAGAEVLIDGKLAGQIPLAASITAPPGVHSIELRRPGYSSQSQVVNVGSGATAEVTLDLRIDSQALEREGSTLVLDVSESPAEFWIDDQRQGFYRQPVRLPRGRHHLRVSSPGFLIFERDIVLEPAKANFVEVTLEPTAETRRSHQASARFHRMWGWTGIIGGAVVAGSGVVLAVIGQGERNDGRHQLDAINAKYDNSEPPCDYLSGYESQQYSQALCKKTISDAQDKIDSGKTLGTAGLIGVGVGGAVMVTGLVLLFSGSDPNKYDHPAARSARTSWPIALVPGPGQLGSALRVQF